MNCRLKQKLGIVLVLCCAGCSSGKDPDLSGSFLSNRNGGEVAVYKEERAVAPAKPVLSEEKIPTKAAIAKAPEKPVEKKAVVSRVEEPAQPEKSKVGLEIVSTVDSRAAVNESPKLVGGTNKPVPAPAEKAKAGMAWFDADASANKSAFLSDTVNKNSANKSVSDTQRKSDAGFNYLQKEADETFVVYISKTVGLGEE